MKKYLTAIITCILLLLSNVGIAQDKVTEELNNASLVFEEGRVSESLELLKSIEKREGLSKSQKENLYRQMTICYIFLNKDNVFLDGSEQSSDSTSNLQMAQASYLKLLDANNIYEVDSMDIIDYVRFTKKFISKPIIIINPKIGVNTSIVDVLQYYGTSNLNIADTAYYNLEGRSPYSNIYTNITAGVDIDWSFYKNFNLSIGGNYTQRAFTYNENLWYAADRSLEDASNSLFKLNFLEKQQWIDVNLKVKYDIGKSKIFLPYVYGGFTYHNLLNAEIQDIQRSFAENLAVGDIKEIRFASNYSFIGGGGFKWRVFDKHYFTVNAEYGRMINPINDISVRYTSETANTLNYALGYVDNNIRLNNVSLMIGFAYAFYNPKMIKTNNEK